MFLRHFKKAFKTHNRVGDQVCNLVKLLIEYRGDIHTSSYSKLAGARQDLWRGNAPFAALLSDNCDMLKLLVESHDVCPNLTSSLGRGANPAGASL